MWSHPQGIAQMGQYRQFSTFQQPMKYLQPEHRSIPLIDNIQDIPDHKRLVNPKAYIHMKNNTGTIYEECSKFINNSNGYPNNTRKLEPETIDENTNNSHKEQHIPKSDPVNIVETIKVSDIFPKSRKMRKYIKRSPKRGMWHKQPQSADWNMEIIEFDEVGVDACEELAFSAHKPTLEEFIPHMACEISTQILCAMSSSPICMKIQSPVYFSISPPTPGYRLRKQSDCISEDSFVIFGEGVGEESEYESESEEDSDDESCTDDEDVVDFNENTTNSTPKTERCGDNIKKVRFADDKNLVEVHHMYAWSYAYQASRKGHWEEYARDRERFKRRIVTCGAEIDKILNPQHRLNTYQNRFLEDQT